MPKRKRTKPNYYSKRKKPYRRKTKYNKVANDALLVAFVIS